MVDSLVESNDRAGLSSFGALLRVGSTRVECNTIDLDGEPLEGRDYQFDDLDLNTCGCDSSERICKVLTSNLEPPRPIDD